MQNKILNLISLGAIALSLASCGTPPRYDRSRLH